MSLSDCVKCWSTPCECGHEYKNWSIESLQKFIESLQKFIEMLQEVLKEKVNSSKE